MDHRQLLILDSGNFFLTFSNVNRDVKCLEKNGLAERNVIKIIMQKTRFLDKAMPSEVENSALFEKEFLAYYWTLTKKKLLTWNTKGQWGKHYSSWTGLPQTRWVIKLGRSNNTDVLYILNNTGTELKNTSKLHEQAAQIPFRSTVLCKRPPFNAHSYGLLWLNNREGKKSNLVHKLTQ